jgi:glycine/D-amino acid oxidase-like deaminating enzyme
VIDPVWPLPEDELYTEVVMRGLATMVPGLTKYLGGLPESYVDGGYYTKTRENRPLIGPAGSGVHLVAGLSGFGVMVAAGAGDLAARHITGSALPAYADHFLLARYDDPDYLTEIASLENSGQL